MTKLILVLSVILFSTLSYAEDKTIPVLVKTVSFQVDKNGAKELVPLKALPNTAGFTKITFEKVDFKQELIVTTIKKVKKTICTAVEVGDVTVYFSFDTEAKLFGIGASSEAGIEVTFKCNNT